VEKLLRRVERRDHYGTLLAKGSVTVAIADVESADAWRASIRRHARADRIRVRTWEHGRRVSAVLLKPETPGRVAEVGRYLAVLRDVVPHAVDHRHEPAVALRDGEEVLFTCDRCPALGYIDAAGDLFVGGSLFEDDCPHDEPPRKTAIARWSPTG